MKNVFMIIFFLLLSGCSSKPADLSDSIYYTTKGNDTIIVFVHGFVGDVTNTWMNTESGTYFPELLYKELSPHGYDVFSASYSANFDNRYNLFEMGKYLTTELEINKVFDGRYKNMIFIAHSMGNFVTRSAIQYNQEHYNSLKIPLILSMGAPSEGSKWATYLYYILPLNQSLQMLSTYQTSFVSQLNKFWQNVPGDTVISCGYEKLSQNTIIGLIVDEKSATSICNGDEWPIYSNHADMVKPKGKTDRLYKWVIMQLSKYGDRVEINERLHFQNIYAKNVVGVNGYTIADKKRAMFFERLNIDLKREYYDKKKRELLEARVKDISNGITCDEYIHLTETLHSEEKLKLLKSVNGYIRKPLPEACFSKLQRYFDTFMSVDEMATLINVKGSSI